MENSSATGQAKERRNSARSRLFTVARILGREQRLFVFDLGMGGLLAETDAPIWPGSYLDLELTLPDSREVLQLAAQVVSLESGRQRQIQLGLRFCRLTAGTQLKLFRFLDRRRALWDPQASVGGASSMTAPGRTVQGLFGKDRPFEVLLIEAYEALARRDQAAPALAA